ncbi:unnamed protein product [marine sediment metagenome]|uniref:Uncharacterized protein n=1 Tax=marine sediment metagenome TaxID=412755 RepID=X1SZM3_9ZZZZ
MTLIDLILIMLFVALLIVLIRFSNQVGAFEPPNPGIGFTWLISILVKALGAIFPQVSSDLKNGLEEFLLDFYKKALETANPWDDFVARFLLRIFSIPVPPEG